jgi:hypothetical protein
MCQGHSDALGAYGVYYPFRANNSSRVFLVSGETAPKVCGKRILSPFPPYYPCKVIGAALHHGWHVFDVRGCCVVQVFRLFRDEGVVGAAEGDAEVGASELLKGLGEF